MSVLHIYAPRPERCQCIVIDCPTCGRLRRASGKLYEWYGWHVTCAGCGDAWEDGHMLERPFSPGWRRKSIEAARAELAAIGVRA